MIIYYAGKPSYVLLDIDYDAIAQVAVSIELVHKASILLDDYIDGDNARHGMEAFHVTYGPERTMDLSKKAAFHRMDDMKEIMHLETAALITNSLLVGYLLSHEGTMTRMDLLQEIGKDVSIIIFRRWPVSLTWKNGVNSSISLLILSLRSAKTGLNNG